MSGHGWIVVVDWERFQHRDAARAQVPTWIKNHTELLSRETYLELSANRRAILHGIWLEYARTRRKLPDNTASLARRLNLKVARRDLEALNHAGFIRFSAGIPAGIPAGEPASLEKRREEKRTTPSPVTNDADADEHEHELTTALVALGVTPSSRLASDTIAAGARGLACAVEALQRPGIGNRAGYLHELLKTRAWPKPPPSQAANVPTADPVLALERQIRNGALLEPIDLEAELRGYHITGDQADELRAMLLEHHPDAA